MLFQNTPDHPHILQILCGDKTETRRKSKRWQMKVGGIYPVHDAAKGLFQRKEDAVCFIRCVDRWEERLGDISEESACREGLYTREEYFEVWEQINGELNLDEKVKVYRFELVGEGGDGEKAEKPGA
ncbi:ASCH domain-containing protein [Candidatus Pyrohabitans sp.]